MISRGVRATCLLSVVILALSSIRPLANAAQQMSGLVYGEGYSFWIDAPKGWELDPKTAKEYGVNVVLYPTGSSFQNAPAVMYANTLRKDETVQDVMKHEADTYREKYKGIQISSRPELQTKDRTIAHVQCYKGEKENQSDEAVAFIHEKGFYVLLVLSARSEHAFEEAYPAYEQLVRSYALSNIAVTDKTK